MEGTLVEKADLRIVRISDFPLSIPKRIEEDGQKVIEVLVLRNPFVVAYLSVKCTPCVFRKVLMVENTPEENCKLVKTWKVFGNCSGREFITNFILKHWARRFRVGVFRGYDAAEKWIDQRNIEGCGDPTFYQL